MGMFFRQRPGTQNMDLDGIIRDLMEERNRLDRLIQTLEERGSGCAPVKPTKGRRGRKSMDGPARQQVSDRMKLYWAKRREQTEVSSGPTAERAMARSTAA